MAQSTTRTSSPISPFEYLAKNSSVSIPNSASSRLTRLATASRASHDQILKRALYERHGVREFWLIHPVDRIVTVYRLVDGAYGRPDIYELEDTLACGILPEVVIDWARVVREE